MQKEFQQGRDHIKFCLELYKIQVKGCRHYVHEHPKTSTAWQLPEMVEFIMKTDAVIADTCMCAFGMTAVDEIGSGLVKKETRIMTSSPEVAKRVTRQCQGGHRHVLLISGSAKHAQVYPRSFCNMICEGIAAQKKVDELGTTVKPVMTVAEMEKTTGSGPQQGIARVVRRRDRGVRRPDRR